MQSCNFRPLEPKRVRGCASQTPVDLCANTAHLSWTCVPTRRICPKRPRAAPLEERPCAFLRIQQPPLQPSIPTASQRSFHAPPATTALQGLAGRIFMMVIHQEMGPGRPKRSRFHLDLRMRHPLRRFYMWVAARTNAGALPIILVCFALARFFLT
jgi:hypothetical protein